MAPSSDDPKSYFPLAGGADDGWTKADEATATCFCGAVQLVFVSSAPVYRHSFCNHCSFAHRRTSSMIFADCNKATKAPGLVDSFLCHCSDDHKIHSSMFASNFIIADTHLEHARGREKLTAYSQSQTIAAGNNMTNYFCSVCGTLMYRVSSGWPGNSILRIGTVDDFHLHATKLKPTFEQFTGERVDWLSPAKGVKQHEGNYLVHGTYPE